MTYPDPAYGPSPDGDALFALCLVVIAAASLFNLWLGVIVATALIIWPVGGFHDR